MACSGIPELAEAPTMLELAKTEADRQALTMMFARTEYGRPYFPPPDVPAARVEALRRAFDATMKDPDFVADAAQLQLGIEPDDRRGGAGPWSQSSPARRGNRRPGAGRAGCIEPLERDRLGLGRPIRTRSLRGSSCYDPEADLLGQAAPRMQIPGYKAGDRGRIEDPGS